MNQSLPRNVIISNRLILMKSQWLVKTSCTGQGGSAHDGREPSAHRLTYIQWTLPTTPTSNHALPNTPASLSEKPTIKYVCLKQQQLMSLRVTLSHGNVTGALSDVWTLTRHLCCSSVQTAPPCDLRTPSFLSLEFSWHKWRLPQRHHPSLTLTTAFMSLIHLWLLCCGFVLLFKNIYWHLKLSFYLSRSLSTTWLAPPRILNNGTWYAGNT